MPEHQELSSASAFEAETTIGEETAMLKALQFGGALAVSLTLAAPAYCQIDLSSEQSGPRRASARLLPSFTSAAGDFRQAGLPRQSGLIAAMPIDDNIQIGLGRFRVAEPPRPRTHMEPERAPTDLRRRERGVAAVGMSLRF